MTLTFDNLSYYTPSKLSLVMKGDGTVTKNLSDVAIRGDTLSYTPSAAELSILGSDMIFIEVSITAGSEMLKTQLIKVNIEDIDGIIEPKLILSEDYAAEIDTLNSLITTVKSNITTLQNITWAGTALYVNASTGNDSNAGTSSSAPLKTITKAVSKVTEFSKIQSGASKTCVIYVAAGTYTGSITARGVFIEIRLQGNVTIDGNGGSAFTANNGGYLYVRSNDTSAADKYINLTITNATYAFYASTFGNVQFRYIKALNITCTTYAFYATIHSYVYSAGNITSFVLNAASTCTALIYANALSYVTLTFTSGACTISATSVTTGCICYYNATVYTRYLKIPSTVTTGLLAKYGGTIIYRNITNSATTPTSAGTGSHIISY